MNQIPIQENGSILHDLIWIIIGVVSGILFCLLLALLRNEFKNALTDFFMIFSQPLKQIYEWLMDLFGKIKAWIKEQVNNECIADGQSPIYYIIGSFLMAILTIIFCLCDWGIISLTFSAMGLEDGASMNLPVDTTTLVAATLICAALFWGIILFDIAGITHLGPWRKADPTIRKYLFISSIFFIFLAVILVVTGGWWRGESLNQILIAEAQAGHAASFALDPSVQLGGYNLGGTIESFAANTSQSIIAPSNGWIIKLNFMGIALLSICTSAVSMVGLAIACKFFLLASLILACIPILIFSFFSWTLSNALNLFQKFSVSFLNILIGFGDLILKLIGKKLNI